MKLKKRGTSLLVAVVTAIALTGSASAHPDDYSAGHFIDNPNSAILNFRVPKSAQTNILTYDNVYKYISEWNGISKNVKVSIDVSNSPIMFVGGTMPVITDANLGSVIGRTIHFSSLENFEKYINTGNPEYLAYMSEPFKVVMILLNSSSSADGVALTAPVMKKTFVHEVGHTLKLKHPEIDMDLDGHTYSFGYPYAVMNQGLASECSWVSPAVDDHDKQCIIKKWGE